jgi:hypothetical protein
MLAAGERQTGAAANRSTDWLTIERIGDALMATFSYLFRRFLAITLGLALTGYSAWASWHHQGDLIGPLAAISAAALLAFTEYAWRDRQRFMAVCLLVLGLAAAAISGSVVLERVSHAQEARAHKARSANLPRQEAQKALVEAQQALTKASAEASDACSDGAGPSCKATSKREDDARKRVESARSQLAGLGAEVAVDPTGGILGVHAETFRLVTLLGLPIWLELAAPVVLAFGFAPAPTKAPEKQAPKAKRRTRRTPKSAKPKATAPVARPALKLVTAPALRPAANSN